MNRFEQSVGITIAVLALAGVACIAGWKGLAEHALILLILPIMWNFDSFQKFLRSLCLWLSIDCRIDEFCEECEISEFKNGDPEYVTFRSESREKIREHLRGRLKGSARGTLIIFGPRHVGKSMFVRNELKEMGARVLIVRESAWMSEGLKFKNEFRRGVKKLFSGVKWLGSSKHIALILQSNQLFVNQITERKNLVDSINKWYNDFPKREDLDIVIDFVGFSSFADKDVMSFTVPYLSKEECYDFAMCFAAAMKRMKWSGEGGFAIGDVAKRDEVERVLFYQTRGVPSAIVALLCPTEESKVVDEILSEWRALLCNDSTGNDLKGRVERVKNYYALFFVLSLLKGCVINFRGLLEYLQSQNFIDSETVKWFMCTATGVSGIKFDEFDVNLFLDIFPEELFGVSLKFEGALHEYDFSRQLQSLLEEMPIRELIKCHAKSIVCNVNNWIFPQGALWKTMPRRFAAVLRLQDWLFDGKQLSDARIMAYETLETFLMSEVYTRCELLPQREVVSVCAEIMRRISNLDFSLRIEVLSKVIHVFPFGRVVDLPQLGIGELIRDIKKEHVSLNEASSGRFRLIRLYYAIILAQAQWVCVSDEVTSLLMNIAELMDEAVNTWNVGGQWHGLCRVMEEFTKTLGAVLKSSGGIAEVELFEAMSRLSAFVLNNVGFIKKERLSLEVAYTIFANPYNRGIPDDVDVRRRISRMLTGQMYEAIQAIDDGHPVFENLKARLRILSIKFQPCEEVRAEDLDWMLTEVAACWNDNHIEGCSAWILDKACGTFAWYIQQCESKVVGVRRFVDYFFQQIDIVEKNLAVPNLVWYLAYLSRMLAYKFFTEEVRVELSRKIVAPFCRCVDRIRADVEIICTRDVIPLAEVLSTNYQYASDFRFNTMVREVFLFDKRILCVVDPEVKCEFLSGLLSFVATNKGTGRCDLGKMSALFLVERILKIVLSDPDADFRCVPKLKNISNIGMYGRLLGSARYLIKETDLLDVDEKSRSVVESFDKCVEEILVQKTESFSGCETIS